MSVEAERQLERLLPRQHGVFTRQQAVRAGFSERMIDRRLAIGRWNRLDRGVYAHLGYASTWEQRCIAAVLAEPFAVLGGKTAAVVHQLPGFGPGRIQITVPFGASHSGTLARVRRSALIEPHVVGGFRVNSVPLTLVELAGEVSLSRLDRAFEDAVLRGLTSMGALADWYVCLARSRRPGIGKIRSIVETRSEGFIPAASELEAMLFEALDAPDIPPVTRQAPFPWMPSDAHRVDGYIEPWGILLEADGRRWHARLQSMEADRLRDQEAVRRGYQPLRFGWVELRENPDRVRAIVRETGRHRTARPRAA